MSETTPNVTAEELAKAMWESQHPISFHNIDPRSCEQFTQMARIAIAKLRPTPAAAPVPVLTVEEELAAQIIRPGIAGWAEFAVGGRWNFQSEMTLYCVQHVRREIAAQITAKVSGPLREEIERLKRQVAGQDWSIQHLQAVIRQNNARVGDLPTAKPAEPSPAAVAATCKDGLQVDGGNAGERVVDCLVKTNWLKHARVLVVKVAPLIDAEVAAAVAAEAEKWRATFAGYAQNGAKVIDELRKDVAARDAEIGRLKGEIERAKVMAGETRLGNIKGMEMSLTKIYHWSFAAADAGTGGVKAAGEAAGR